MALTTKLNALADAIRNKVGVTEKLDLDDMISAVGDLRKPHDTLSVTANGTYDVASYASANVNVGGGQDHTVEDGLIDGTFGGEYSNPRVTQVVDYAFYNNSRVTSISFQAATTIGDYAFQNCSSLASVNLPSATTIGDYAFHNCSSLVSVNSPSAAIIEWRAFSGTGIRSFDSNVVTTLGAQAFTSCPNLVSVNLPLVTRIDNSTFSSCSELVSANFPACTSIANRAFGDCSKLNVLNIYSPDRTTIPTLATTSAFQSSGIASGTGWIVINDELVDTLKAATNWSTYASQIIGHTDAIAQGIISA